jgi:hypothetical protein
MVKQFQLNLQTNVMSVGKTGSKKFSKIVKYLLSLVAGRKISRRRRVQEGLQQA